MTSGATCAQKGLSTTLLTSDHDLSLSTDRDGTVRPRYTVPLNISFLEQMPAVRVTIFISPPGLLYLLLGTGRSRRSTGLSTSLFTRAA